MEGYGPSTYGDRIADVYDEWYPGGTDAVADVVTALCRLAGSGPVLELGCGTGRLAVPLAATGLEVVGLDASPAMLDRLRAKAAPNVSAVLADMAAFDLPGGQRFSLAFVAFNSLFNLADAGAIASCFASVARHLLPGGRFALECFEPADADAARSAGDPAPPPVDTVEVRDLGVHEVVLRISRHDARAQTVWGQHVHITEAGIRLRPWHLRYAHPAELDRYASAAGLVLEHRWGDWGGSAHGADAPQHVSVYRRPSA
jgi:SAM-dependent methyltransferase